MVGSLLGSRHKTGQDSTAGGMSRERGRAAVTAGVGVAASRSGLQAVWPRTESGVGQPHRAGVPSKCVADGEVNEVDLVGRVIPVEPARHRTAVARQGGVLPLPIGDARSDRLSSGGRSRFLRSPRPCVSRSPHHPDTGARSGPAGRNRLAFTSPVCNIKGVISPKSRDLVDDPASRPS